VDIWGQLQNDLTLTLLGSFDYPESSFKHIFAKHYNITTYSNEVGRNKAFTKKCVFKKKIIKTSIVIGMSLCHQRIVFSLPMLQSTYYISVT
jgi:hypothetical protein